MAAQSQLISEKVTGLETIESKPSASLNLPGWVRVDEAPGHLAGDEGEQGEHQVWVLEGYGWIGLGAAGEREEVN